VRDISYYYALHEGELIVSKLISSPGRTSKYGEALLWCDVRIVVVLQVKFRDAVVLQVKFRDVVSSE
jgi:hypothetical protein